MPGRLEYLQLIHGPKRRREVSAVKRLVAEGLKSMGMAVFLTGFLVFSLVYSNALLGVVSEAPSAEAWAEAIRGAKRIKAVRAKPRALNPPTAT